MVRFTHPTWLGGLFNALVAPDLFSTIIEYPLVIAVACLLRPRTDSVVGTPRTRWFDRGVLLMHVSNRYLDLAPIVGNIARDRGVPCRIYRDDDVSQEEEDEGKFTSTWMILARQPDHLGKLLDNPKWEVVPNRPDLPLWTDDFSNIMAVLNWR